MKPYYQDEHVTIYCGDCREVLPSIPMFKTVITDPPVCVADTDCQRQEQHIQSRRPQYR